MSTVAEIESAIENLPADKLQRLLYRLLATALLGPLFAPYAAGRILLTGAVAEIGKTSRRRLLDCQSGIDSI